MQKAVGFNEGNLSRELYQLADGKLKHRRHEKVSFVTAAVIDHSKSREKNHVYPLTMLICYRPPYQRQHEERQMNHTAETNFIPRQAPYIGNVKKAQLTHFLRN